MAAINSAGRIFELSSYSSASSIEESHDNCLFDQVTQNARTEKMHSQSSVEAGLSIDRYTKGELGESAKQQRELEQILLNLSQGYTGMQKSLLQNHIEPSSTSRATGLHMPFEATSQPITMCAPQPSLQQRPLNQPLNKVSRVQNEYSDQFELLTGLNGDVNSQLSNVPHRNSDVCQAEVLLTLLQAEKQLHSQLNQHNVSQSLLNDLQQSDYKPNNSLASMPLLNSSNGINLQGDCHTQLLQQTELLATCEPVPFQFTRQCNEQLESQLAQINDGKLEKIKASLFGNNLTPEVKSIIWKNITTHLQPLVRYINMTLAFCQAECEAIGPLLLPGAGDLTTLKLYKDDIVFNSRQRRTLKRAFSRIATIVLESRQQQPHLYQIEVQTICELLAAYYLCQKQKKRSFCPFTYSRRVHIEVTKPSQEPFRNAQQQIYQNNLNFVHQLLSSQNFMYPAI